MTPGARIVDAGSTDPRAQRTRAAILEATTALLTEDGDFSVQQVADRAGISRASFYTHFSGIDGVLDALLMTTFGQIRDAYEDELLGGGVSAVEAMHNANALIVRITGEHRTLLAGMLGGAMRADAHETIATAIAEQMRVSFARGIYAVPDGIDTEVAAIYVASAAAGALAAWVTGRLTITADALADHLTALMPQWLATASNG